MLYDDMTYLDQLPKTSFGLPYNKLDKRTNRLSSTVDTL